MHAFWNCSVSPLSGKGPPAVGAVSVSLGAATRRRKHRLVHRWPWSGYACEVSRAKDPWSSKAIGALASKPLSRVRIGPQAAHQGSKSFRAALRGASGGHRLLEGLEVVPGLRVVKPHARSVCPKVQPEHDAW